MIGKQKTPPEGQGKEKKMKKEMRNMEDRKWIINSVGIFEVETHYNKIFIKRQFLKTPWEKWGT